MIRTILYSYSVTNIKVTLENDIDDIAENGENGDIGRNGDVDDVGDIGHSIGDFYDTFEI
ncbi:hypothetical protein BOTNAR_0604g00020 [Botryotinia narcissicola]|uniref:Uncharacterized protein n=1 Tax=Botryotinia narcissicola TaxID=278944 RepID=A0A4Z1HHF9_9HELO|nr:hypothetical protein BOTNAR_0604g00020 [Botryotinia narcissicola]